MQKYQNLPQAPGIYKIFTEFDARVYIGSSKSIRKRIYMHLWNLRRNKHHSKRLQLFYNKYGEESLKLDIIELCEEKQLAIREQYWIDKFDSYRSGFNGTPEALTHKGKVVSETQKAAISEANKGRVKSQIALETFKIHCQPKCRSVEANLKRSQSHIGKKVSIESIQKRIETLKIRGGRKGKASQKQRDDASERMKSLHLEGRLRRKHPKVSDQQVVEIRQRLKDGAVGRVLSREYGLSETTISEIRHNKVHKLRE